MSIIAIGTFYFIIFITTFLFYIEKKYTTKNNIFEKIAIFFLIIVAGFRYNTGRDYFSYYQIYIDIQNGGEGYLFSEPGFHYLLKVLGYLNLPYNFVLGIISTFVILIVYYSLIKPIPLQYRYVSAFFFLIVWENYFNIGAGSIVRQSIAVAFFVLSAKYIVNKKIISYLGTIILGALFHLSILLLIPLYFIRIISIKFIYLVVFLLSIFYIFPSLTSDFLQNILNFFYLSKYTSLEYISVINRELSLKEILKNIFYVLVFMQFIYVAELIKYKLNKKEIIYIKLLLIGFIFKLYISIGIDLFQRMLPYFYIFYVPVVFIFLKNHKNIKNGYIMLLFLLFFLSNHISQIMNIPKYSKYHGQYQFIPFKNEQDIKEDLSIWQIETMTK